MKKSKQHHRAIYSDTLKQKVLREKALGVSFRNLSKRFSVPVGTINSWERKQKAEKAGKAPVKASVRVLPHGGKKTTHPSLRQLFIDYQNLGIKLNAFISSCEGVEEWIK